MSGLLATDLSIIFRIPSKKYSFGKEDTLRRTPSKISCSHGLTGQRGLPDLKLKEESGGIR